MQYTYRHGFGGMGHNVGEREQSNGQMMREHVQKKDDITSKALRLLLGLLMLDSDDTRSLLGKTGSTALTGSL